MMTTFDFSPLLRSNHGFDRVCDVLELPEAVTPHLIEIQPSEARSAPETQIESHQEVA